MTELRRLAKLAERMAASRRGARRPALPPFSFHHLPCRRLECAARTIESLRLQIGPYFHVLHASDNWRAANSAHRAMHQALKRCDGAAAVDALRRDIDPVAMTRKTLLGQHRERKSLTAVHHDPVSGRPREVTRDET